MFSKLNQVCVVLCTITVAVYAAQEGERTSTIEGGGMMSAQEANEFNEMMKRLENKPKAKDTCNGKIDFRAMDSKRSSKKRRVNTGNPEKVLRNKISRSKRGQRALPSLSKLLKHFETLESDCILTQYANEDKRKLTNAVTRMRRVVRDDKEIVSDNATPEQILERLTCIDFACTHCRGKRTVFQKSKLYSGNFDTPLLAIDYFSKTLSEANKGTVRDTTHLISLCIKYYAHLKPKQLKNLLEVAGKLQTESGKEQEDVDQLMEWVESNNEGVITPLQASCLPEAIVFPIYLIETQEDTFRAIAHEKDMIYDSDDDDNTSVSHSKSFFSQIADALTVLGKCTW
jgi:iron-sulfur cluster repair protein YtfE (RIC family)